MDGDVEKRYQKPAVQQKTTDDDNYRPSTLKSGPETNRAERQSQSQMGQHAD